MLSFNLIDPHGNFNVPDLLCKCFLFLMARSINQEVIQIETHHYRGTPRGGYLFPRSLKFGIFFRKIPPILSKNVPRLHEINGHVLLFSKTPGRPSLLTDLETYLPWIHVLSFFIPLMKTFFAFQGQCSLLATRRRLAEQIKSLSQM